MNRLTSKASVILLALTTAIVLMAAARQPWVTGTVDDPVLGASRVQGTGTEVATALVALTLAASASAVVAATSGRIVRILTMVTMWACTLGLVWTTVRVLTDPAGVLGRIAATTTGRTGSIETAARVTAWPWVALAAEALLVVAGIATVIGARRWTTLGRRYEVGGADSGDEVAGARGERVHSDWERLSSGEDPTED